ncbi:MAG: glycosyltransferase [Acidimicrobiales bacterium]
MATADMSDQTILPSPVPLGRRAEDGHGGPSVLMVAPGALFLSAISYYSASVARALHRREVDVRSLLIRNLCPRLLYPGRGHIGQYDLSVLHLDGIPAYEALDWFSVPSLWVGYRLLRQQRPRVLLLQWWTSAMAHNYLALARYARRLGCSVVLELHELRDVGEQGIPLAGRYTHLVMSRLAAYTDGVIVHSQADQEAVPRQYPELGRLPSTVIFHGPQEHGSDGSSPRGARPAGLPVPVRDTSRPVRFLYFGVIRPYKGLPELVRAFRTLVQEGLPVHLTVAGEPWSRSDQGLGELAECGPERCTTLLKYISDEEVAMLFADCDVLVAPYRRVSASGPISMAMGAGMPIVTTRIPALQEACESYEGVEWANVSDSDSLAGAMRRALDRVGTTYDNPHSWDTNAELYLGFFSKILSQADSNGAKAHSA